MTATYELVARLQADTSQFVSGMREAEAAATSMNDKVTSVSASLVDVGKTMSMSVTAPIVAAGTAAVFAFNEEEDAIARMESALAATGGVAGITSDHIKNLAANLQKTTTFGDETTISAAGLMLTFKKLRNETGEGNDVFDRALKVSQDLSAFMGTDLNTSAMQLARALQEPTVGLNMLRRSGVSFSDEQREQIATMAAAGDTLGAQKIILEEVEDQFGGTAAMMAQTTNGQIKVAMNTLGDSMEQMGALIAPFLIKIAAAVDKAAIWFQGLSPEIKKMVLIVGGLAASIGPLLIVVGKGIKVFQSMKATVATLKVAMLKLNASFLANPIFLIVAALAALVAAGVWAYHNVDWFREIVDKAWQGIQNAIDSAWEFIKPIWASLVAWISGTLVPAFQQLWEYMKIAWDGIAAAVGWAWDNVIKPVWGVIVWYIENVLVRYLQLLWTIYSTVFKAIASVVVWAWNTVIKPAWDAISWAISNVLIPYIQLLWNVYSTVFKAIAAIVMWAWNTIIKPIWDLISWYIGNVLVPYYTLLWTVVKEVFTSIGEIIGLVWNYLIKPVWENIQSFIVGILVPIFHALWITTKTVWGGVSSAIGVAWGFIASVFEGLKSGIGTVAAFFSDKIDSLRGIFNRVIDIIQAPFKTAFNYIADAWNNTIGGFTIKIPDLPGIPFGGSSISIPEMPRFHNGGMVPGISGREVPALLQAGEFVVPRNQVKAWQDGPPRPAEANVVNVTVHGSDADPYAIGQELLWALKVSR